MNLSNADWENLNLEEICRSCMSKKQKMRPLFGSSLDSMLMAVADVKVSPDDGFPAQMCVQCVLQVSRAFTFKQQCEKSDTAIRDHLARLSTELDSKPELQLITLHPDSPGLEYRINGNAGNECVLILRSVKVPPVVRSVASIESFLQPVSADDEQQVEEQIVEKVEVTPEINRDSLSYSLDQDLLEDDCYDSFEPIQEECLIEDQSESNYTLFSSDALTCEDCHSNFKSNVQLKSHKLSCPALIKSHTVQNSSTTTVDEQPPSSESPPPSNQTLSIVRFECIVCKKKFSDKSKLRRHSRTHLVQKPHVCQVCGMSFAESSNLTKHSRKHTGELRNVVGKPNLCSVCGKRFKWTTSLSKHMKHHTKRKLFWCSYPGCGKYYVEQRSLNVHSYTHDGKKPFSCQYCSKGFTQKCNLDKHERVHTKERPFRCSVCHKSFAQSGYLVIHQRIHGNERRQ